MTVGTLTYYNGLHWRREDLSRGLATVVFNSLSEIYKRMHKGTTEKGPRDNCQPPRQVLSSPM